MRIKIKLTKNSEPVPINNQHIVNSYIHKCLGVNNKYHDVPSDYCISNIRGGVLNDDKTTLRFVNYPFIIITSLNGEFLNDIIKTIMDNDDFGYGIKVDGFEYISEELYDEYNIFRTLTPILLKEKVGDKYKFLTINDDDFVEKLKNHTVKKLFNIDNKLDFSGFDLKINQHINNKTKLVMVKNVKNVGSLCDIIICSNKKITEMIYNCGLGQSTGSGFGNVYVSKNHHIYYQ